MTAVRLLVSDLDRALHFYCDQLEFRLIERWGPAFAMIERDGVTLWLSGPQTSAAQPLSDGTIPSPGGWNRVVVKVDDLSEALARFELAGYPTRNGPLTGPGGTQALVEDGCGNVVELFMDRD